MLLLLLLLVVMVVVVVVVVVVLLLLLLLLPFGGHFADDPVEDKWAACCRTSPDGERSLGDRDRPTVPYW
jgi:hypothetical protein